MLEFILARYNYWIVIILMMTGLYIVFSRGNLVKTIVGLNLFQTSVFIFYITVGKVNGGTAPILVYTGKKDKAHGAAHGAEHGAEHGADGAYGAAGHGSDAADHADHGTGDDSALSQDAAEAYASGEMANSLEQVEPGPVAEGSALHTVPDGGVPANDLFANADTAPPTSTSVTAEAPAIAVHTEGSASAYADASHAADGAHGAGYGSDAVAEVIYSNPLPHVLILTAIVVGVATTAVGLALAIRIREAYGTIEEDALEAMNNDAEFVRGETATGAAL